MKDTYTVVGCKNQKHTVLHPNIKTIKDALFKARYEIRNQHNLNPDKYDYLEVIKNYDTPEIYRCYMVYIQPTILQDKLIIITDEFPFG